MSRVQNIIDNVRLVLSDPEKQRYSDTMLLSYLNAGLNDFVLSTKILKERIFLELNTSAAIYDLSPYVLEFKRFEFETTYIPVKSQEELDKLNLKWKDDIGEEIKCIVLDKLKKGWLRTYPRITVGANAVVQNSVYGGIVDITINDDNYQIPSIGDVESGLKNYLTIYAIKKPKTLLLTTPDSELELGSEYDIALEYFVTARALRSDTDALNRNYGAEQLQLYNNYVSEARVNDSIGNESASDRIISYRGGIR